MDGKADTRELQRNVKKEMEKTIGFWKDRRGESGIKEFESMLESLAGGRTQIGIKIAELRDLVCKLLLRIEQDLGYPTVIIRHDGYWDMLARDRYNLGITTDQAAQKLIGLSLKDDWEVVEEMGHNTLPDSVYALVHIGPLLRAIGEEIVFLLKEDTSKVGAPT
jgi:hypothetical protein